MPHFGEERPVMPLSYTIYPHCNRFYADPSRELGLRRFSDIDAGTVIKAAADSIPKGGRILLKPHIYLINEMIETASKAVLFESESISYQEGFGVSAILRANAAMEYIIKTTGQWTSFSKLVIDGNSLASGISLGGLDNYIERCFPLRCVGTYGINLVGTYNQWVQDCWIEWNNIGLQASPNSKIIGNHFVANDQSFSSASKNVKIIANDFGLDTTRSINIWGSPSEDILILGNWFKHCGAGETIVLGNTVNNVEIAHNTFDGDAAVTNAIWSGATLNDFKLADNTFKNYTGAIFRDTGVLNVHRWHDNLGFVTENSGLSTGTGAQQTIAHGLALTPDRVQLTDLETGAAPYQSAAADAVNIYVTAVINQDYLWKAWVM